jgi:hypothetical protein
MDTFIIRKIKALKRVKPEASWLKSQRSFLLSEISRAENKKRDPSLVLPLFNFNILKIFRPAFAFALAIIILITSLVTIGAISLAQNSLPGDLLYPLKTAFEQTQLTFTPSQENKAKLSIKFATHRIDEFTQLIDKPEKKKDMEKTVKKFTEQLVSVQENIDKLKEKNTEKAAEVAKLVKSQTPIYEETLIESSEKLANIIPGDKEDLKEDINQALMEINKTEEVSEELIPEEEILEEALEPSEEGSGSEEQPLVPVEEEVVESPSMPFENLQEEFVPGEEGPQEEQ